VINVIIRVWLTEISIRNCVAICTSYFQLTIVPQTFDFVMTCFSLSMCSILTPVVEISLPFAYVYL
jgi:hypothetical protein